jgi:hypothetical protein
MVFTECSPAPPRSIRSVQVSAKAGNGPHRARFNVASGQRYWIEFFASDSKRDVGAFTVTYINRDQIDALQLPGREIPNNTPAIGRKSGRIVVSAFYASTHVAVPGTVTPLSAATQFAFSAPAGREILIQVAGAPGTYQLSLQNHDRFESARATSPVTNLPALASTRVERELTLPTGDSDWYRFQTSTAGYLSLTVLLQSGTGADLQLYRDANRDGIPDDANRDGTLEAIGTVAKIGAELRLTSMASVLKDETFLLRLSQAIGNVRYDLTLNLRDQPPAPWP